LDAMRGMQLQVPEQTYRPALPSCARVPQSTPRGTPQGPPIGPRIVARMQFRPELEGLRGVAVALVVLFHARLLGFSGGFVGVDAFYVLSGFLITRLLLGEIAATGSLDLVTFYAR